MIWMMRYAWKVDHTTKETSPLFSNSSVDFYVPFDFDW